VNSEPLNPVSIKIIQDISDGIMARHHYDVKSSCH